MAGHELAAAKSGFKWKCVMPTQDQIMKMKENSKKGWILEVDLEYPKELQEEHNCYPLAPEKKIIAKELMLGYQKHLMDDLNLDLLNSEKLVLMLEEKLRGPQQKPAVVSQTGHAFEKGAPSDQV